MNLTHCFEQLGCRRVGDLPRVHAAAPGPAEDPGREHVAARESRLELHADPLDDAAG